MAVLTVDGLVAGYDPEVPIVNGVDLVLARGEILAVLGPNGAGKSTLIRAIAGLLSPSHGRIQLGDSDITRLPVHRRCAAGLAYVPQLDNVFASLSLEDNLLLAAGSIPARDRRARVAEVLSRHPELAMRASMAAGRLSGGQRQTLAVARALLGRPEVLLLDEPSAGLSPRAVEALSAELRAIAAAGTAILLVERNVRAALSVAHRVMVLAEGRTRLNGTPAELALDAELARIYLGRHAMAVRA
jgi:branched-chain amino acid transport system ATP-binding protein